MNKTMHITEDLDFCFEVRTIRGQVKVQLRCGLALV
jgi:hypothetical protein